MGTTLALSIGLLAGAHTSTWGMFKDATHPRMPPEHVPIARCEGGDLLTIGAVIRAGSRQSLSPRPGFHRDSAARVVSPKP